MQLQQYNNPHFRVALNTVNVHWLTTGHIKLMLISDSYAVRRNGVQHYTPAHV